MTQRFKKKAESEKREIRLPPVRVTAVENEKIRHAASIRQLDIAEFIRRSVLARKADVRYETEIVLKLSEVVRGLRFVHREMIAKGMKPPEAIWLPIIEEAKAAMIRISK